MYNYDVEKNVKSILCGNVAFFFFFLQIINLKWYLTLKKKITKCRKNLHYHQPDQRRGLKIFKFMVYLNDKKKWENMFNVMGLQISSLAFYIQLRFSARV